MRPDYRTIRDVADFVAEQFDKAGLIKSTNDLRDIESRLCLCDIVLTEPTHKPFQATAGVLLFRGDAMITCLASTNPSAAMKVLLRIGRECFMRKCRRIYAVVHPDHAKAYTGIAGAKTIGKPKPREYVGGALGVTIVFDLESEAIRTSERWMRHVFNATQEGNE